MSIELKAKQETIYIIAQRCFTSRCSDNAFSGGRRERSYEVKCDLGMAFVMQSKRYLSDGVEIKSKPRFSLTDLTHYKLSNYDNPARIDYDTDISMPCVALQMKQNPKPWKIPIISSRGSIYIRFKFIIKIKRDFF